MMTIRTSLVASVALLGPLLLISHFPCTKGFHVSRSPSNNEPLIRRGSSSSLHTASQPRAESSSASSSTSTASNDPAASTHGLAILTMPTTSVDRIANDVILETALRHAIASGSHTATSSSSPPKLSIVLRNKDQDKDHSLARLRRYVGEVYSSLWDAAMEESMQQDGDEILDVVVYPQNLPNSAPERWITHNAADLQWICSHDSICGWSSDGASGRGTQYVDSEGAGGLDAHVQAINVDRNARELLPVQAVAVEHWPEAVNHGQVVFLDDECMESASGIDSTKPRADEGAGYSSLLGGAVIPSHTLYNSIAVGGTFDGMHYGHRKLLTLAVSSVFPNTGKLLVGVTVDEMLQHKQHADLIPPYRERAEGVRQFLHRLAPGIKNRIQIVPIRDAYGPPGSPEQRNGDFEALVLSHETLHTGHLLNLHRQKTLGLPPLVLLCTRRTEPNGMSSTAMRRLQYLRQNQLKETMQ